MTIKARLQGVAADLEVLADLFAEGDALVLKDDDGYYLTAPEVDNPPAEVEYYEAARNRLLQLNGLARLDDPQFRPIQLSGRFTDGDQTHHVVWADAMTCTARLGRAKVTQTYADGTPAPLLPSPWPDRARVAANSNPAVGRVLLILARQDALDWYDLYKIHEIIRRVIEPQKLDKLEWTTKARDRAFTVSADRYEVSGDAARHAVDSRSEPPKQTMTITEGRDYISNLVVSWLDSMARSQS